VYIPPVKRKELERRLRGLGWRLQRHGGKHDLWTNADGSFTEGLSRHPEINERLAQVILRRAKERR
jgi:predicted RNA binding protein YcfA (HicA-like mRNA interferase family)